MLAEGGDHVAHPGHRRVATRFHERCDGRLAAGAARLAQASRGPAGVRVDATASVVRGPHVTANPATVDEVGGMQYYSAALSAVPAARGRGARGSGLRPLIGGPCTGGLPPPLGVGTAKTFGGSGPRHSPRSP